MEFVIQVYPSADHATVTVHPKPARLGDPLEHAVLAWRCVPMKSKTHAPRPPWETFEHYDDATHEAAGKYLQRAFRDDLPIRLITLITAAGSVHAKAATLRTWAHGTSVLKRKTSQA